MARDRLLTRKAFEAWLRGKQPHEAVGLRREVGECPLACYLRDQGVEMPCVGAEHYQAAPLTDGKVELPAWAKHVVSGVDFALYSRYYLAAPTAREVRRILRAKRPS